MKVKEVKVGDIFSMEIDGRRLSCVILECHGGIFPGVLNFTARLENSKDIISLCGLADNDYLHFGCNLKEASRAKNKEAFTADFPLSSKDAP